MLKMGHKINGDVDVTEFPNCAVQGATFPKCATSTNKVRTKYIFYDEFNEIRNFYKDRHFKNLQQK